MDTTTNPASVREGLEHYASKRVSVRLEALDLRSDILSHENARAFIRDKIKLAGANEIDANGKPLHSNEDKRKAERDRRESENTDLRRANEEIDRLNRRINVLAIDADFYADMIRIGCAFASQE